MCILIKKMVGIYFAGPTMKFSHFNNLSTRHDGKFASVFLQNKSIGVLCDKCRSCLLDKGKNVSPETPPVENDGPQ